ncbi:MAG: hypothetical protein ABH951_02690 [Patescibacteria group bacterium]
MDNIGNIVSNTAQSGTKPFDPTYVNLEYIFQKIINFFGGSGGVSGQNSVSGSSSWSSFQIFLFILIIFFLAIITYCLIRIFEIRKKEKEYLEYEIEEYAHKQKEKEQKLTNPGGAINEKWQKVLTNVFSQNEGDWKIAVIEADIMLDELMDQLGFKGENLGEKLKSADQESFKHLTSAWEIHTVRNKIAHEGSDFQLSQHEAKRIIVKYEQIFRDYGIV